MATIDSGVRNVLDNDSDTLGPFKHTGWRDDPFKSAFDVNWLPTWVGFNRWQKTCCCNGGNDNRVIPPKRLQEIAVAQYCTAVLRHMDQDWLPHIIEMMKMRKDVGGDLPLPDLGTDFPESCRLYNCNGTNWNQLDRWCPHFTLITELLYQPHATDSEKQRLDASFIKVMNAINLRPVHKPDRGDLNSRQLLVMLGEMLHPDKPNVFDYREAAAYFTDLPLHIMQINGYPHSSPQIEGRLQLGILHYEAQVKKCGPFLPWAYAKYDEHSLDVIKHLNGDQE